MKVNKERRDTIVIAVGCEFESHWMHKDYINFQHLKD